MFQAKLVALHQINFNNQIMNTYRLTLRSLMILLFILSISCKEKATTTKKQSTLINLDSLLTINEVGATVLPDTIASIRAPFDMPQLKKPVFNDVELSIIQTGAKENHLSTKEIQLAIDKIHQQGGGKVIIPAGDWKSGRIILKSNVNLHLEAGANLYFSGEIDDFLPTVFTRHAGVEVMSLGACIYAYKQHNIAITGKGTLYGPAKGSILDQQMTQNVIEKFVPLEKPVSERIYDGANETPILLPAFISPILCTDVYIEGVTLERTAFWNIVPIYCDKVIIRGVTVNSVGIPKGDGIDIVSSKNVLIEYSTLNSGDDCFTMKAGRGQDGVRVNKPTENVIIRYCLAQQGHGGMTIGSETAGMIRNIYMHDCVFENTTVGIRFKTRRPRAGGGENFYYKRIRMNLKGTAFKWDMLGQKIYVGELASRLPVREVNALTPKFSHVNIQDILVEKAETFLKIYGIPESPLEFISFENIQVNQTNSFFAASDAHKLRFNNVSVQSKDSLMFLQGISDVVFDNVNFKLGGGELHVKTKGDVRNIRFENSVPSKPVNWNNSDYKLTPK